MLADNRRIWGVYALEEEAHAINDVVAGGHGVATLYRSPTLTDAEREAIARQSGGASRPTGADEMNPDAGILSWEQADQIMQDQRAEIERLRLTDAEREAIETAMNAYGEHNDDPECEAIEAALWGLLERTK
jgi:isocitrate dehydrogenase